LITISRLLARQIRNVFRRAMSLSRKNVNLPIQVEVGPKGLRIRAVSSTAAVEFHDPSPVETATACIPFELLSECEGPKHDTVVLFPKPDGQVEARWENGRIPVIRQYHCELTADAFPAIPAELLESSPSLLKAIAEAVEVTDQQSSRYALGHVLLDGSKGHIGATDGRQLLLQSGFQFPWQDEVLVPGSSVFGCKELAGYESVSLSKSDTNVVFRIGPWTLAFPIPKDARFPRLDDIIPPHHSARTVLTIPQPDRAFLADTITRLPGNGESNAPVTVDLNGSVAIRSKADGGRPTELVLTQATREGEEVRISSNRLYLQRAARLGFDKLYFFGDEDKIVAHDDRRDYLWMPLSKDGIVKPSSDCLQIESPPGFGPRRTTKPRTPTPMPPMTNRIANQVSATTPPASDAPVARKRRTIDKPGSVTTIDAAIALRSSLRDTLGKTNELIRSLKKEKKQQRLLKSTLASLNQLRTVA